MSAKPKTRPRANIGLEPGRAALMAPEEQAGHHHRTRTALRTAVAEDYVELIADLIETTGEARATDIARRLGVTNASVAKMVARLHHVGLVTTQPYRAIFLTPEGKRIAAASKRRHEIVVAFLLAIGVGEDAARAFRRRALWRSWAARRGALSRSWATRRATASGISASHELDCVNSASKFD